ncbi:MAG: LytTR family DNA-binding domain-containing protein [Pseudomonadota bacterium]
MLTAAPTALICDDEPLLREQLKSRLAKLWPQLCIVVEAANGDEAVQCFNKHQPDIVFLDIHMPLLSGLEAAKEINISRKAHEKRCQIVFVTAYDQYAVEAFEHGAIDYVLKPFNNERLGETIDRLKERLVQNVSGVSTGQFSHSLDAVLIQISEKLQPASTYLQWIKASVGQTVRLIPVDDVLYFQSDEKYTCVALADSEVLIRKSIKELLVELDPNRFWQIHRATIVNTRAIAGVVRGLRDQADLKLKGRNETLTVSRNYTHLFKQM